MSDTGRVGGRVITFDPITIQGRATEPAATPPPLNPQLPVGRGSAERPGRGSPMALGQQLTNMYVSLHAEYRAKLEAGDTAAAASIRERLQPLADDIARLNELGPQAGAAAHQAELRGMAARLRVVDLTETMRDSIDAFVGSSSDIWGGQPRASGTSGALTPPSAGGVRASAGTASALGSYDLTTVRGQQQALVDLGFDLGSSGRTRNGVDGAMGPKTRAAIEAFQRSQGLVPTGELDPGTLNSLRSALAQRTASSS